MPLSNNCLATVASSYLNLNLAKQSFKCRQSSTNLFLPDLFVATVNGFTTSGLLSTSCMHPFDNNFCTSSYTNCVLSLADLLFLSSTGCGIILLPRPLSNDPRFNQYIYRYSHASKRSAEVYFKRQFISIFNYP